MSTIRTVRILVAAVTASLLIAAVAPAATAPQPVVTLKGSVTPNHGVRGTPLTLNIDTGFKSVPAGGNFVLQSLDYLFPAAAVTNGKLFPSCSVNKLRAAHGILSACPKGSKIGTGVGYGIAVAIGVASHGNITLFNGPGGKSITMNIDIEHPAVVNSTWTAPLTRTHGKYGYKLSVKLPPELKTIIGGDIVVTRIVAKTGATITVHGKKRGYIEGVKCPKGGKAPFHADFVFNQGASAHADANITCKG